MRKISNKPKSNDYEVEIQNPFAKAKNIQVTEDPERSLAILRIYGQIEEPEEYIEEIAKLDSLSKKYDVLEITLNSPGGSLNTTVDLASIINHFSYVVTIGKGEIASAAFMIWTMGDIKVVTDYSMYMAHRESYGMYGKTSEHRDAANTFGKVYEEMFTDCFADILTNEEKAIADRSEAWISYKDLMERPGVISYDSYVHPKNPYSIMDLYATQDGKTFIYDEGSDSYVSVTLKVGDEILTDMTEYLYGITEIAKLPIPKKIKTPKKAVKPKADEKNVKLKKEKKQKNKED
jgi:ATP-dependent protease ClpP protease subunit